MSDKKEVTQKKDDDSFGIGTFISLLYVAGCFFMFGYLDYVMAIKIWLPWMFILMIPCLICVVIDSSTDDDTGGVLAFGMVSLFGFAIPGFLVILARMPFNL